MRHCRMNSGWERHEIAPGYPYLYLVDQRSGQPLSPSPGPLPGSRQHPAAQCGRVWEIQIKAHLGKLTLTVSLADLITNQRETNNLNLLDITLPHILALDGLTTPHKDSFDRLLAAQANVEEAVLVSQDAIFAQYPVKVVW